MIGFIAAVLLIVVLMLACTWAIRRIVQSLRDDGILWTIVRSIEDRSTVRAAMADVDHEYAQLLHPTQRRD